MRDNQPLINLLRGVFCVLLENHLSLLWLSYSYKNFLKGENLQRVIFGLVIGILSIFVELLEF